MAIRGSFYFCYLFVITGIRDLYNQWSRDFFDWLSALLGTKASFLCAFSYDHQSSLLPSIYLLLRF